MHELTAWKKRQIRIHETSVDPTSGFWRRINVNGEGNTPPDLYAYSQTERLAIQENDRLWGGIRQAHKLGAGARRRRIAACVSNFERRMGMILFRPARGQARGRQGVTNEGSGVAGDFNIQGRTQRGDHGAGTPIEGL